MKTSTKKVAFIAITSCVLGVQSVHATGIPVVDGAMATLTQAQNTWVQVTQFVAETKYYANMVANWDVQLKSMIADKLDELKGEDKKFGLSEAEKKLFFQAKEYSCVRSSGSMQSAQLCKKMVKLEITMDEVRMKNYSEKRDLLSKINKFRAEYNSLANDKSAKERRKSLLADIEALQDKLNSKASEENATIQQLKDEYNLVAEARQIIVKNQLEGAKEFDKIKKNITTNDIANKVQAKTDDIQTKINNLKNQNNVNSENAFMQNSKP